MRLRKMVFQIKSKYLSATVIIKSECYGREYFGEWIKEII